MGKQFLKNVTDQSVKNTVNGILDSYHNYWDLLAELTQNSRDAILRRSENEDNFQGKIQLYIDYSDRSIHILDNGIGISEKQVEEFAAPNSGDKITRGREIGQKGVGLTYCIFKGDLFQIKSRTLDGKEYAGKIVNGNKWLTNGSEQNITFPVIEDLNFTSTETCFDNFSSGAFTYICVKNVSSDSGGAPDIFNMSPEQLEFLLTTRTIIGNVNSIFDEENFKPEFEFDLMFKSVGVEGPVQGNSIIQAEYPRLHSTLTKSSSLNKANEKKLAITNNTSLRSHFKGRIIYEKRVIKADGHKLEIYAVLFPTVGTFKDLSKDRYKLGFSRDEFNEDYPLFQSGIFVATKGMPTSIVVPHPSGGSHETNYKRMFFLVQDDQLNFDMGRKTIHYTHVNRIQKAVKKVFSDLEKYVPLQGDKAGKDKGSEWTKAQKERQRNETWKEINKLDDLGPAKIAYCKTPDKQEAGVVAIFHELLGAGLLGDGIYKPMKSGYGTQYDLYAKYIRNGVSQNLVIEFKSGLEAIIKDLDDQNKHLSEMDLLVAWDANIGRFDDANMTLEPVDEEDNQHFFGVNYELITHQYEEPIPVILLKKYIDDLPPH